MQDHIFMYKKYDFYPALSNTKHNNNMIHRSILVLDGNQRSSLAVIRSIGEHGNIRIFSADITINSLAGCSKYCNTYYQHPSPVSESEGFIAWLVDFIDTNQISMVIPCTEISSRLILMNRDRLHNCHVPFADLNTVMQLSNKANLMSLAGELGILYPATIYTGVAANLPETVDITYPIIIKPTLSNKWIGDRWISSKVYTAHDKDELNILLKTDSYLRDYPFLLQEYISGTGTGVFALFNQGEPVAYFAHKRIREKPPWGGVSVLSESIEPDSVMKQGAEKLLKAVNWHGVAMVEFRISHDGIPYLMEVNTRFWGSLQLAIDCGVNFPYMLYQLSSGIKPETVTRYRSGQRLRWLLGDLDSLYLTLRDKKHFTLSQKLKCILDFITPHLFKTRHEIDRLNDLEPAWHELKQYIKQLLGKD